MIVAEEHNFMYVFLRSHIRIYFWTEIAAAVSLLEAYIFWPMYPTITKKTDEDQDNVIIEVVIPTFSEFLRELSPALRAHNNS